MPAEGSCTFGAVGDIVLCGTIGADLRSRGTSRLLEGVRSALGRADVLFGNLECVVLPPGYPDREVDPRGLVDRFDGTPALAQAGFDVLSLANNHILDAGTSGLLHTRQVVEARGMAACGVGATQSEARTPRVVERGGLTWGFLCYAEDSNYSLSTSGPCHAYYEPSAVLADIERARAAVDVLVVSVHADLEFVETPSPRRRDAFREFARAGATFVLGHHPHVPQGVERVGSSLVAHSLGNFVFPVHTSEYLRPHLPRVGQSFVLLAEVSRAGVGSFERVPVEICPPPGQRPVPVAGAGADALLGYLEELDRMVADDARVAANWRRAALRKAWMTLEQAAGAGEEELVRLAGRLFLVAENRAWLDELAAAAGEVWERQRLHVDPLHRPSHATSDGRHASPRPSLLSRLRRRAG